MNHPCVHGRIGACDDCDSTAHLRKPVLPPAAPRPDWRIVSVGLSDSGGIAVVFERNGQRFTGHMTMAGCEPWPPKEDV